VDSLVPRLAEKGLVGLAVTPLSYIDQFPPTMIEAANRLGFPLIELPPRVSFIDIIQPLTNEILNLQADALRESQRIHNEFIELVLGGGGFAHVAQGIAQHVQRPVSIIDRFRRVLGSGFIIGQPQPHLAFLRDDGGGEVYLGDRYQPHVIEEISGSEARRLRADTPGGPLEHLDYPIKVGPTTLGHIVVWGSLPEPRRTMDLAAVEHGATVAALKMMEERSIGQLENRFRNEILEGLLSDRPADRSRALALANQLGWHLTVPYALVLIGPDLPSGTAPSTAGWPEQSNIDTSLYLAKRYVRTIEPQAIAWSQGARLVVFLPRSRERPARWLSGLVEELRRACRRVATDNPPYTVSAGVSGEIDQLDHFPQAYRAARHSLEIGRALSHHPASVTQHEDLGLFRIIPLAESATELERFCRETLGPLLAHDGQHGAELVKTLRVYLENNQNATRSAEALHIHYNTLRYRLDRIRDLIGDRLEQPAKRLALEVALQIHPLLGRTPAAGL
jgi:purine catabolism regulator